MTAATHPLSLHQLVVADTTPLELVGLAAATGCAHVCLFTQPPEGPVRFPVVEADGVGALARAMDGEGVTAYGITSFAVGAATDVAAYRPALERGARLGARVASTRIVDPDLPAAAARFAELCELAAPLGIRPCIEFSGMAAADTLERALQVVTGAGHPNSGITLDALHVVRTGATPAALRALDPAVVGYVQLCDGPPEATPEEYAREASRDRLAPGEGRFPLAALVGLVPPGAPLSLEVPTERFREAGVPALERARRVVASTRRFLDALPR